MNWDAIGAIGEIIGAVAVVVTLIVLVVQIKQNTSELRASTASSLLDRSIDLFGETMRSEIPEILAKQRRGEPLCDAEAERFKLFIRRNLQLFEQVYLQYREHRVSDEIMSAYDQRIRTHFEFDTWDSIWPQLRPLMTESFQNYVERLSNDV